MAPSPSRRPPHPVARRAIVISSCTKLVKIPPVCPSLQPAQCGNHLMARESKGQRRHELKKREGEIALDPPYLPPLSSLNGILQRAGALATVCRPSAAR